MNIRLAHTMTQYSVRDAVQHVASQSALSGDSHCLAIATLAQIAERKEDTIETIYAIEK